MWRSFDDLKSFVLPPPSKGREGGKGEVGMAEEGEEVEGKHYGRRENERWREVFVGDGNEGEEMEEENEYDEEK